MLTGINLIADINSIEVKPGQCACWWLGQHGFAVKLGRTVLYVDAFLMPMKTRNVAPLLKPEEVTNADAILFQEEELDPAIKELRPLCLKQRTDTFQWYHTLGKLVAKHYERIETEREKYNRTMYGQHFFERLADAIQVASAGLLRACFNLYYFYPEGPAFRELAGHKAVSPTHALRLATIQDPRERRTLQQKVIDGKLTVRDLDREIRKTRPKPRKRGAGRPYKVPSSLTKALIHITAQSDTYRRAHEDIWFGEKFNIAAAVPDIPSNLLSDSLREQLEAALKGCESLARVAEAEVKELRSVLAQVDKRRAAQAEYDRKAREEMACAAAG
jgi:hypothetical protein